MTALAGHVRRWLAEVLSSERGLDLTDYVAQLEREFGIDIGPEDTRSLQTLGDLTALVAGKVTATGRPAPDGATWQAVRRITARQFGVAADELSAGTRFVEDLNC